MPKTNSECEDRVQLGASLAKEQRAGGEPVTQREWHGEQQCTGLEADPRPCREAGVGEAEKRVGRARGG